MARERPYVFVDGPAGSGKTTLVQRLLESNRARLIMAARFMETRGVKVPTSDVRGNDETRRYAKSGATHTLLYRYPAEKILTAQHRFWDTEFILNYSEGIVFEGAARVELPSDLNVFVTRPLPEGDQLLRRGKREVGRLDLEKYLSLLVGFELDQLRTAPPAEVEPGIDELNGEMAGKVLLEIPDEVVRQLRKIQKSGYPLWKEGWKLKESHSELARAGVVVINIHDPSERPAAERLASEVRRLREDQSIAADVLRWGAGRCLISIFITHLADPRDKDLKRALARLKRPFARRAVDADEW